MAKIKKAQKGFTLPEAKRKRDSLDYDAKTRMQAARERTLGPKGYDDISQELVKRARKSDSLKNVFDKAIKKSAPKAKDGGKWIQSAIKKPGALRKSLGAKKGEHIPSAKLAAAAKKPGKMGQRARLAQTLKKMKKK
jgi:hypothetical protein